MNGILCPPSGDIWAHLFRNIKKQQLKTTLSTGGLNSLQCFHIHTLVEIIQYRLLLYSFNAYQIQAQLYCERPQEKGNTIRVKTYTVKAYVLKPQAGSCVLVGLPCLVTLFAYS